MPTPSLAPLNSTPQLKTPPGSAPTFPQVPVKTSNVPQVQKPTELPHTSSSLINQPPPIYTPNGSSGSQTRYPSIPTIQLQSSSTDAKQSRIPLPSAGSGTPRSDTVATFPTTQPLVSGGAQPTQSLLSSPGHIPRRRQLSNTSILTPNVISSQTSRGFPANQTATPSLKPVLRSTPMLGSQHLTSVPVAPVAVPPAPLSQTGSSHSTSSPGMTFRSLSTRITPTTPPTPAPSVSSTPPSRRLAIPAAFANKAPLDQPFTNSSRETVTSAAGSSGTTQIPTFNKRGSMSNQPQFTQNGAQSTTSGASKSSPLLASRAQSSLPSSTLQTTIMDPGIASSASATLTSPQPQPNATSAEAAAKRSLPRRIFNHITKRDSK